MGIHCELYESMEKQSTVTAGSCSVHTTVDLLNTWGTGTSFTIVDTFRLLIFPQNEEVPSNFILPN
jgi:hypothetical protein